jgi:molybdate transport system ATP-binding protein
VAEFDLDFTLRQDSFVLEVAARAGARALALFGPSGSGKTSVLETIAGLRVPQRGRITINGHVLFDKDGHVNVAPRHRRVGYVPQDVLLFPHLDVRQNVTYGRRRVSRPGLDVLLDLLELHALMDRKTASLSGGERQRVAIARALYSGPEVLLLDEPLAAVDIPRRRRIVGALLEIRDRLGMPLVYVTHAPEEAMEVADVAIVLDAGRMIACGAPREVLES